MRSRSRSLSSPSSEFRFRVTAPPRATRPDRWPRAFRKCVPPAPPPTPGGVPSDDYGCGRRDIGVELGDEGGWGGGGRASGGSASRGAFEGLPLPTFFSSPLVIFAYLPIVPAMDNGHVFLLRRGLRRVADGVCVSNP